VIAMDNMKKHIYVEPPVNIQPETLCGFEQAEIYTLTVDELSRNQKIIERREFKNRMSERRSRMRLTANGEPQSDRRLANRIAYVEMCTRLKQPQ
jgi:hypothetical protein